MNTRPRLSFVGPKQTPTKEIVKKGDCPSCKGKSLSFRKDNMIWKRCLSCDNTWCLGGSPLLLENGEDKQNIIRELLREPDYVQISTETKKLASNWEQDQELMNRNSELLSLNRFLED